MISFLFLELVKVFGHEQILNLTTYTCLFLLKLNYISQDEIVVTYILLFQNYIDVTSLTTPKVFKLEVIN